jgi:LPXTG-site transpeptidase (sortase) family protein
MRPYKYVKIDRQERFVRHHLMITRGRRIMSGSMALVGLALLTYIGGYYGLWQVKKTQLATKANLEDTFQIATADKFMARPVGIANKNITETDVVAASEETDSQDFHKEFSLTINALKIRKAKVTTDVMSDNRDIYMPVLASSLAHYEGSAYPGQQGNTIIYGHSLLPAFYNPENYLAIFSKLDELNAGDQILVSWGQDTYSYKVRGMSVVAPNDTRVLRYNDGRTLTLLTCVPPGLTTERLLVFADME